MKRTLLEARADLESGIAKSLGRGKLNQEELTELEKITVAELMHDHGLDSIMAEKIMIHAQTERLRSSYQDQYNTSHLDDDFVKKGGHTRTHPITESNLMSEDHHGSEGRMMDYGHTKSDSSEGRMARQALYNVATYGAALHDMLEDGDDLPQWCHYKIASSRAGLAKVKHYIEYKLFRQGHADIE